MDCVRLSINRVKELKELKEFKEEEKKNEMFDDVSF